MAVVVNNPPERTDDEPRGTGVMGIFLLLIFFATLIYFLVVYALPGMRQSPAPAPTGAPVAPPTDNNRESQQNNIQESPEINVPDQIDVNIKPTGQ